MRKCVSTCVGHALAGSMSSVYACKPREKEGKMTEEKETRKRRRKKKEKTEDERTHMDEIGRKTASCG